MGFHKKSKTWAFEDARIRSRSSGFCDYTPHFRSDEYIYKTKLVDSISRHFPAFVRAKICSFLLADIQSQISLFPLNVGRVEENII